MSKEIELMIKPPTKEKLNSFTEELMNISSSQTLPKKSKLQGNSKIIL
jgi:hypothetical protein